MEVELLKQLLLDAGAYPVAKKSPIGCNQCSTRGPSGRSGLTMQLAHDDLEEEEGGFCRLPVFGEVALDAPFFLPAEGRIGEDHVHPLPFADLRELMAQGVLG